MNWPFYSDYEEYPQTCEIQASDSQRPALSAWSSLSLILYVKQNRCVNMIARMFHAPMHTSEEECMGCSTVGSSEAIMLAVLSMKRRWQIAREEKGLSKEKPNLVMGANVQVSTSHAWHVLPPPSYWYARR